MQQLALETTEAFAQQIGGNNQNYIILPMHCPMAKHQGWINKIFIRQFQKLQSEIIIQQIVSVTMS